MYKKREFLEGGCQTAREGGKTMKNLVVFYCFISLVIPGCRFVEELINMAPPEIISFSPDKRKVDAEGLHHISISFSRDMEKTKTESAFSLSENEVALDGRFSWSSRTMMFTPAGGFKEHCIYRLGLSTAAEDSYGNSLLENFSFEFSTKEEECPPTVEDHSPQQGVTITDLLTPVTVTFSEAIRQHSIYSNFTMTPPSDGNFNWEADNIVTFTPFSPYEERTEYRVDIGTGIEDLSGNCLAEPFSFYFSTGEKQRQDVLGLITSSGVSLESTEVTPLNEGIEKDETFIVSFRLPVDTSDREGIIDICPDVKYSLTWSDDFTSCTITFPEYLKWNNVYTFTIAEKTYNVMVNGEHSEPPYVTGVTFCQDIDVASCVFQELSFSCMLLLDSDPDTHACFDVYIHHAEGATIDLGSFASAFSISCNNSCASIDPVSLEKNPLSPTPSPPSDTNETIIRIYCTTTDTMESGIITLSLDAAVKDTYDNQTEYPYTLPMRDH
jgi:hypothetical protein